GRAPASRGHWARALAASRKSGTFPACSAGRSSSHRPRSRRAPSGALEAALGAGGAWRSWREDLVGHPVQRCIASPHPGRRGGEQQGLEGQEHERERYAVGRQGRAQVAQSRSWAIGATCLVTEAAEVTKTAGAESPKAA